MGGVFSSTIFIGFKVLFFYKWSDILQYRFFALPAVSDGSAIEEEMNSFIRSHKVLTVQREFVSNGMQSYWCCCVEFIEGGKPIGAEREHGKGKVDYREILSSDEFARFALMRECRRELATTDDVPPYVIFLDEHLAKLAKLERLSLSDLKSLPGIGEQKTSKYGKRFLELMEERQHASSGKSLSSDS